MKNLFIYFTYTRRNSAHHENLCVLKNNGTYNKAVSGLEFYFLIINKLTIQINKIESKEQGTHVFPRQDHAVQYL